MLGNCAIGRLRIVRAPTITRTMEITMATIGRLIKNFDIGLPSPAFRSKWLGVHLHARTHFLHALDDDAFPRAQSFVNDPQAAYAVTDFDRPDAHFVLGVHYGH